MYFSKNLQDLNLNEAALLAGLPQAPSDYSPVRSKGAAKARRNEVLRKMAELGMITQEQADRTIKKRLGVKLSQYFSKRREEYFFDYVKDQLFQRVRRADGARGRHEGLHDDRPQEAAGGARRDQRPISRASARRRRS